MDARGGKLLEFLKENNHLDLEVPDIAFSIKKSEKSVETALLKLQQKGLVTARQNEYGRVYWYALPSAPITRTFKPDDFNAIKEQIMSDHSDDDDAVDLSELQEKSVSKPAKKSKKITKTPDVEAFVASEPAITGRSEAGDRATPAASVVETAALQFEPSSPPPAELEGEVATAGKQTTSKFTLPLLIIIGVISVGAFLRGCTFDSKIAAVSKSVPKDIATKAEVAALSAELSRVETLETAITKLTGKVDSLNNVVDSLKTSSVGAPAPAPVVARRKNRKKR